MNPSRLLALGAALLATTVSFAQLTRDQKNEVLTEIDRVMTKEAFVPGVDLGKWRDFVADRKERLSEADSPSEFAAILNGAFRKLGLSHVQIQQDRRRHWGGGDEPPQNDLLLDDPLLEALQGRRAGRFTGYRWISDDTALVRIPSFTSGYDEESVEEIFDRIKDSKYLIVDLRGNPGGEVENMRHFLGLLLPSTTSIGTFVSRKVADEYEEKNGLSSDPVVIAKWAHQEFRPQRSSTNAYKGQIAVLIDGGSASASEIVANALREAKRCPIVGMPSAGAVLVSTFDRLSYGFRIQYPVGDYVSAAGLRLEGHPLVPDVRATESDAVDSAVSRLKGLAYWIARVR